MAILDGDREISIQDTETPAFVPPVFDGLWPVICEFPDCLEDAFGRVRVEGRPIFLCEDHMICEPFSLAPRGARDVL